MAQAVARDWGESRLGIKRCSIPSEHQAPKIGVDGLAVLRYGHVGSACSPLSPLIFRAAEAVLVKDLMQVLMGLEGISSHAASIAAPFRRRT